MNQPDRKKFHAMLLAKQIELQNRLARRDDLEVQVSPDEFDARLQLVDREFQSGLLHQTALDLREVRAALVRIEDDSYGVCAECDDAISPARLQVIPWANYCVKCQEQIEVEKQMEDLDERPQELVPSE
ncbi:MAG: TraR/DksA C4-type zinc finger protein [Acidobacteria bacterium]|jgi:DnaK suppressor protein|nr:TraR/DksA C4-type zinc finger protein [Bryobacteraceae bacterium CoA2 C42]